LVVVGLAFAPHVEKKLMAEPAGAHSAPVTLLATASGGSVTMTAPDTRKESGGVEVSQASPAPLAAPAADLAPPVADPEPAVSLVTPTPAPAPRGEEMQDAEHVGGHDYLQKMRDAGYPLDLNNDLDTIMSLRAVGVTPEYAKAMAATGMGTPTAHDLVSMKAQGITPEYVAQMKAVGLAPGDLHELISLKAVGVTPDYAKAMAATGIGTPTTHDLVSMKAQGITPEYVAQMKTAGLAPGNLHELISLKAVGVTPEYAKSMADAGFPGMPAHELVSLKAQGVTPESVRWTKTAFPNADLQEVRKAAIFHIDEQFLNKAKAHGFNSTDLDKLVKLKMTGLLD
jgi:hypothetical protein